MSKTVMSDTFIPPHHEISTPVQNSLKLLLKEYDSQFTQDEMSIDMTPLTSMSIDTGTTDPVSQKPYPIAMKHYDWVKNEIEKLLAAKDNLLQPLQLVSSYYSCSKRWWR